MIEGLGHLHEDVFGEMWRNVRAPEPRGGEQEEIDLEANPLDDRPARKPDKSK